MAFSPKHNHHIVTMERKGGKEAKMRRCEVILTSCDTIHKVLPDHGGQVDPSGRTLPHWGLLAGPRSWAIHQPRICQRSISHPSQMFGTLVSKPF